MSILHQIDLTKAISMVQRVWYVPAMKIPVEGNICAKYENAPSRKVYTTSYYG